MKIFIAADHRGYQLKNKIAQILTKQGYDVQDLGAYNEEPCDYPALSFKVGNAVAKTKNARGILVCLTGIGHAIAANKVHGINAALCYNREAAILSREHNDANVLVLGAKFVPPKKMPGIIDAWLKTSFAGGRHWRRVRQIRAIERKICLHKSPRHHVTKSPGHQVTKSPGRKVTRSPSHQVTGQERRKW